MKIIEALWGAWVIISTFYTIACGLTLGIFAIWTMNCFYINFPNYISMPAIAICILALLTGIAVGEKRI